MEIILNNLMPSYMSKSEIQNSDIYLKEKIIFESGMSYLLIAHSGHGKSSLLNFIYGCNINYEGEIIIDKKTDNSFFNFRKSDISYVFQDLKLFDELTAFENIQIKNMLTNHKTEEEIIELLQQVSLYTKKNTLVGKLSLGQKQRIAIIRALCQPFRFLLLDEPFSHLDKENVNILKTIIDNEIKKNNSGLIMTSLGEVCDFKFDKIFYL